MKWQLHRSSYAIGVLMGICVGIGVGYIISICQGIHRLQSDNSAQVVLGIATLHKLQTNDQVSAQRLSQRLVSSAYLEAIKKRDSWWDRYVYGNSSVIESVEKAAKELPGLAQEIEARKKENGNQQGP